MVKNKSKSLASITSALILGFVFGAVYWFLDVAVNVYFSADEEFYDAAFSPGIEQILTRTIIFCIILIFFVVSRIVHNKRKSLENTLIESEDRFRSLLIASSDGIMIHNGNRIIETNQKMAEMLGYEIQEIVNKSPWFFLDEESQQRITENLKGKDSAVFQATAVKKNEKKVTFEFANRMIIYQNETIWITTSFDCTISPRNSENGKDQSDHYRHLLQNSNDPLFVYGLTNENSPDLFLEASEMACTKFGYSPEEYAELNIMEIVVPEERDNILPIFQTLIDFKHSIFETEILTKDNDRMPVEISSHLFDLDNRPMIISTMREITERKKANQLLRNSEKRYRQLFALAPAIYMSIDPDGNISDINDKWSESFGYSKDETIDNWFGDFLTRTSLDHFRASFADLIESNEQMEIELEIINKDKTISNMILTAKTAQSRFGDVESIHCILLDNSRQRCKNEDSQKQKQWLEQIIDNTSDVIFSFKPDCTITNVNPAFEEVICDPGGSDANLKFDTFVHPDDLAFVRQAIKKCIEEDNIPPIEIRLQTNSKTHIPAELIMTPFYHDGEVIGIDCIAKNLTGRWQRDKSEEKNLQEDQKLSEAILKKSEAELSAIFNGASSILVLIDGDCKIRKINTTGLRFADSTEDEILGKPLGEALRCQHYIENSKGCGNCTQCEKCTMRKTVLKTISTGNNQHNIPAKHPFELHGIKQELHLLISTTNVETSDEKSVLLAVENITDQKLAEESLLLSELSYRTLTENLPGLVYRQSFQEESKTRFFNNLIESHTGYPADELDQSDICPLEKLIHQDDRSNVVSQVKEAVKENRPFEIEYRLTHKNGDLKYFIERGQPVYDPAGTLISIEGVIFDITERKLAEESLKNAHAELEQKVKEQTAALRESEERLELVIDGAQLGTWDWNIQTGDVIFNERWCEILGYSLSEIETRFETWKKLLHPDDASNIMTILDKNLKGETSFYECEQRLLTKSGEYKWVQARGKVVEWDKEGNALRHVGTEIEIDSRKKTEEELNKYRAHLEEMVEKRTAELTAINESLNLEISEHRQAEEALRSSEEKYRNIVELSVDGIYLIDKNCKIIAWNQSQEKISGLTKDETLGRVIYDVQFLMVPEERKNEQHYQMLKTAMHSIIQDKESKYFNESMETEIVRTDGVHRTVEILSFPIRSENNFMICSINRDITDKKLLEDELAKAEKLESIGILAGGIAHDFNNILTAILGNISLAKMDTIANSDINDRLVDAEKASERAQNITRQLLTFSKGGAPIKKTISIKNLLKESARFALHGSNVKGQYDIPDDLSPIDADIAQISQVLNNLIINANQAMPDGGAITISAKNVEVGQSNPLLLAEGKYVRIKISDEGTGIPEDHLNRIFDPYFTTKQKGSGLGLATTYSIIKNHDGHIDVESTQGEGTSFIIHLPISDKPEEIEIEKNEVEKAGGGKILVMDDEDAIRMVTGVTLTKAGYKVDFAVNGEEAVAKYKSSLDEGQPFDLIFMDLTIPGGMGGHEAFEKIKEIDPDAKAIVSSGYSNNPIMADYEKYGFCGVITKPYNADNLNRIVYQVLHGDKITV